MKNIKNILIGFTIWFHQPYLSAQQVTIIPFKTLETLIKKDNDTTYIVNFFAAWCAPCVKELPEFTAFAEQHKVEKMQLLFVSLDFKKDYEKSLTPLSKKLNLGQNVYLLDEKNPNNWIDKININWGGDIPATLFLNNEKHFSKLYNQSFTKELLFQTLKSIQNAQ